MRNCFVPHCDAFCKKNGIIKRMMFSAPKVMAILILCLFYSSIDVVLLIYNRIDSKTGKVYSLINVHSVKRIVFVNGISIEVRFLHTGTILLKENYANWREKNQKSNQMRFHILIYRKLKMKLLHQIKNGQQKIDPNQRNANRTLAIWVSKGRYAIHEVINF